MTQADLDHFRRVLLDLRTRLRGDVSHLTEEARQAADKPAGGRSSADGDDADSVDHEVSLSLLRNEEQVLQEIGDALERWERGVFGRCDECGTAIPKSRLQALPYARHCVGCARKVQGSD